MQQTYQLLAEGVLLLHFLFVLFIVLGQILVVSGGCLGWLWIRNRTFRLCHLLGITVVVAESWIGWICPLTTLEMWLKNQAGQTGYEGSFIQYWLGHLLYYNLPPWVFIGVYTAFGLLVVISWVCFPPRKPAGKVIVPKV